MTKRSPRLSAHRGGQRRTAHVHLRRAPGTGVHESIGASRRGLRMPCLRRKGAGCASRRGLTFVSGWNFSEADPARLIRIE